MGSSRVERYRIEIQNLDYTPLCDEELKELQQLYRSREYRQLTGIDACPEAIELLEMFLEEKFPPDLSQQFVLRFVNEELFALHNKERRQQLH